MENAKAAADSQKSKRSAAEALEEGVFRIADQLESLAKLAKTLELPKELAEKYKDPQAKKRARRQKHSEIDSGQIVLDKVNEIVGSLADLSTIEGADRPIYVPEGVVGAVDSNQDPNAFVIDQLNSLLDREYFLRSRNERFQQYFSTLQQQLQTTDSDEAAPPPAVSKVRAGAT